MRRLCPFAAAAAVLLPSWPRRPRPRPPSPPAAPAGASPAAAASPAGPNTWTVDTAHSSAGFSVKHVVSTVRGTLGPIRGTVDYDGKSIDTIKADITIDVNGVNTNNENRDRHLKGADFFDVAKHPTVTFKSKRVEPGAAGKFKLIGDLTMHGVTKEVTLDVEGPSPAMKQPANGRHRSHRRVGDDEDQPQGLRHAVEQPDGRGRSSATKSRSRLTSS